MSNAKKVEIVYIPLCDLEPDPQNVRRYKSEAGISQLKALILSQGLLKPLLVRPAEKEGKWYVTAGSRRLRSLNELAKDKAEIELDGTKITKTYGVMCRPLHAKHDPVEVSLAENEGRENMDVADRIEAYRVLVEDKNQTPEAVGDKHGVSHMTVRRYVKLAHVAPPLMQAFRQGEITLEKLQAFALCDNQETQLAVYEKLDDWTDADQIKRLLCNSSEEIGGRLMKYVTLKAYEAAGGTITRDLFSDENEGLVNDSALLNRMALDKLTKAAQQAEKKEGWAWSAATLEHWLDNRQWPLCAKAQRDLTAKEQKACDKAQATMDELQEVCESGEASDKQTATYEKAEAIIDEIERAAEIIDPAHQPFAGVVAHLDHNGRAIIARGRMKPEDHKRLTSKPSQQGAGSEADHAQPHDDSKPLSEAVVSDLRLARMAALQSHLAAHPEQAFALGVHAAALQVFATGGFERSYGRKTNITCRFTSYFPRNTLNPDPTNDGPLAFLQQEHDRLVALLPAQQDLWLSWCLAASQADLQAIFAYCAARQADCRAEHAGVTSRIEEAIGFDIGQHWTISPDFLKRLSKAQIIAALKEAGANAAFIEALPQHGKAEVVAKAHDFFKTHPWQPTALRIAAPAPQDEAEEDLNDEAEDEGHDEAVFSEAA